MVYQVLMESQVSPANQDQKASRERRERQEELDPEGSRDREDNQE